MVSYQPDTFYGLDFVQADGVKVGDVLIRDRPLRDWKLEDFSSFYGRDWLDWETLVWQSVSVGVTLEQIIGTEFANEFFRMRFEQAEVIKKNEHALKLQEAAVGVFPGKSPDLVSAFSIPHLGWESDNEYAAVRVDGEIRFIGTDHGQWEEVSRENILNLRDKLAEYLSGVETALNLT